MSQAPRRVVLERHYPATLDDVWAMWTTKKGIESWWGPDGFAVTVRKLDLRPGGQLLYAMSAVGREQIAFMKREGMPVTQECTITFSEVVPLRRLAYLHLADFIPGVTPYDVATTVELSPTATGVHLVLGFDAMHDPLWTERATMGWDNELSRLATALAAHASTAPDRKPQETP